MSTPTPTSLLRLEVARLRSSESRRRFDTVVHLGQLGQTDRACVVTLDDQQVLDAGTRMDVVSSLLESQPQFVGVCVWLTRPGEPQLQDEDLAWFSAATRAFGALGHRLEGFWSVTRTGWLDVRTGEGRTWKRLRL